MRRALLQTISMVLLVFAAPHALGWSYLGHRLIGELAQRQLTPAAAAEVAELLKSEPEPSLAGVASWADNLRKSNPDNYSKTERWHYINFPTGTCAYRPQRDCANGDCVVAQIERQRRILGDRTQTLQARREALKFLVHFIGDVHQPLHASNRKDKGGNSFQISLRTDLEPRPEMQKNYVNGVMGTNLHSVWDHYVLASAKLPASQYADLLAARSSPLKPNGVKSSDPVAWAQETCNLIDANHLYSQSHKMDGRYLDAQRPLAEKQLAIAAARLANLLNSTLTE